jgi:hypothetical protein
VNEATEWLKKHWYWVVGGLVLLYIFMSRQSASSNASGVQMIPGQSNAAERESVDSANAGIQSAFNADFEGELKDLETFATGQHSLAVSQYQIATNAQTQQAQIAAQEEEVNNQISAEKQASTDSLIGSIFSGVSSVLLPGLTGGFGGGGGSSSVGANFPPSYQVA